MVMVRRNELACRNAWSASLWEPVSGATDSDETRPRYLKPTGPLPPANADDIRAVVSQNTIVADSGEDVLLSEARIIAEPVRFAAAVPQPEAPRPTAGFDPRTALFRAHEAHREKTRARDAAARQSESIEPGRIDLGGSEEIRAALENPAHDVPNVPVSAPPAVSEPPAEPPVTAVPASEDLRPQLFEDPEESDLRRWLEEAEAGIVAEEPAREEMALTNLFEFADKPLPSWFHTDLPRTCRTCRDFRPSLEGDTGWCANRWAFNKALGEPQQLVHADESIPCSSPIGNWWAAVDDVWLVAADVSHHSRPTPLMDRYLPAKTVEKKRS